jgi:hypothetical protein
MLLAIATAASVEAHHAAAPHFLLDQTIELQGVITEWKLVNPHSYIYLDVTDGDGVTVNWRCSLTTVARMKRRGWTKETLQPGMAVTITGSPARREAKLCAFNSLTYENGITIVSGEDISALVNHDGSPASVAQVPAAAKGEAPAKGFQHLANGQPDISGPWITKPNNFVPGRSQRPPDGGPRGGRDLPAPTEAGKQANQGYDPIYDSPALHCQASNIVSAWSADGAGNKVVQGGKQITMRYGFMDVVRTIHLDRPEHPDALIPSLAGHSIGQWEDDVLVVHTIGFEQGVLFSGNGLRHSAQMEVTERFELSEDGQELSRSFTVHDPDFLESDWSGVHVLTLTDETLELYDCIPLEGANNQRAMRETNDE